MSKKIVVSAIVWLWALCAPHAASPVYSEEGFRCPPTRPDSLGPFYQPGAPVRSAVGEGYVLFGTVRSARSCQPVPGARIEIWLTNPQGVYDDAHRATVVADAAGDYRFESARPPRYGFRPPHIHLRITADGFATLITQHYPEASVSEARFDLVLVHAEK